MALDSRDDVELSINIMTLAGHRPEMQAAAARAIYALPDPRRVAMRVPLSAVAHLLSSPRRFPEFDAHREANSLNAAHDGRNLFSTAALAAGGGHAIADKPARTRCDFRPTAVSIITAAV